LRYTFLSYNRYAESTFKSGGTFYYDEALRDAGIDDVGARFIVKRWREE